MTTMTSPTPTDPASMPIGKPQGSARPAPAATQEAPAQARATLATPGFEQLLQEAQSPVLPPQALIDTGPSAPAEPEDGLDTATHADTTHLPTWLLPMAAPMDLPATPSLGLSMRSLNGSDDLAADQGDDGHGRVLEATPPAGRASSGRVTVPGWLTQPQASTLPAVSHDTALTARPLVGGTSASTARAPLGLATPADTPPSAAAPASTTPSWSTVVADLGRSAGEPAASLKLPTTSPTQWREPLLTSLGEKIQWQTQRGVDQAVIRLEPPQLGRVDIVIRQEAGVLQIHISATHRDVMQQLQGVSEQLRQDLTLRHAGEVSVQLSDQMRQGDGRQRQGQDQAEAQRPPGRALTDTSDGGTSAFATFHEQADA